MCECAWLEMDVVALGLAAPVEKPGEKGSRCHSNSHSHDYINVHPHSIGFHIMSQMTVHSPISIYARLVVVFSFILLVYRA